MRILILVIPVLVPVLVIACHKNEPGPRAPQTGGAATTVTAQIDQGKQLYVEKYEKLDPSTTAHVLGEIEETIATADFMALDDLQQTRFYQEWGRPQGLVDFATAVLDRTSTGAILLGVFRQHQHGLVDDDARWRMRQIVPHIRRAMLIGKALEFKTAEADAFAETLNGLSAGMFLVDQDGRIIHANASGHALLGEGAALYKASDRMRPCFFAAFSRFGKPFQSILSCAIFKCAAKSPES